MLPHGATAFFRCLRPTGSVWRRRLKPTARARGGAIRRAEPAVGGGDARSRPEIAGPRPQRRTRSRCAGRRDPLPVHDPGCRRSAAAAAACAAPVDRSHGNARRRRHSDICIGDYGVGLGACHSLWLYSWRSEQAIWNIDLSSANQRLSGSPAAGNCRSLDREASVLRPPRTAFCCMVLPLLFVALLYCIIHVIRVVTFGLHGRQGAQPRLTLP